MKLEVLVGLIASGKSTYARKRADEGAMIVCHDDLTEMLHGRYRYEQANRELYRRMEESLAREALLAGKDVVIDRTHLTRESRRRWIRFANEIGETFRLAYGGNEPVPVVAVVFPIVTAYEHAARRYDHDNRGRPFAEWFKVALHHEGQMKAEPLEIVEGFDEIVRIGEVA